MVALVVLAATAAAAAEAPEVEQAEAAAQAWLELVDSGRYAESWQQAATLFRDAISEKDWVRTIAAVRGPLGAVESRERVSAQPTTQLPGAPDGHYVVIQYRTRFAHKSSAVETVTPMLEEDGTWRVSGYYVR